jgi:hypothetical protein
MREFYQMALHVCCEYEIGEGGVVSKLETRDGASSI